MAVELRTVAQRHTTLRVVLCRITLYWIKAACGGAGVVDSVV